MALPTAFSNNTAPTGPQLDGNFAAVGALTVIGLAVIAMADKIARIIL